MFHMNLKITNSILHPHLPGDNDFNFEISTHIEYILFSIDNSEF